MTKTAAEVEMEVEASRGQLDRTMEALKDKMTPGQLFDEASHAMGGMGEQLLSKFMEQAKENPMPLAVMGVGLAWLMAGSKKGDSGRSGSPLGLSSASRNGSSYGSSSNSSSLYGSGSSSGSGLKDKMQHLGDKAGDMLSHAKDSVSHATHSVADSASSAQDTASQAVHTMTDKATTYSQQAVSGAKDLIDREPLLLAGIGVLIGVGLAAALPSTSLEDRSVGSMRDDLLEKGQAMASDSLDKVADTAQAAFGAVKSELGRSDEGAGDLSSRVENATHAGLQAAKEHLTPS